MKRKLKFTLNFIKGLPKVLKLISDFNTTGHSCPLDLAVDTDGSILVIDNKQRLDDGIRVYYRNIVSNDVFSVRD